MSYRPPARLAHVYDDQAAALYLAHVPDGAPVILEGSAALIWLTATGEPRPDGPDDVAARIAQETDLSVEEIREDVVTFLGALADCLRRTHEPADATGTRIRVALRLRRPPCGPSARAGPARPGARALRVHR